jgi:lysine-specific demethylase/histidyl-hydroxylase NO66
LASIPLSRGKPGHLSSYCFTSNWAQIGPTASALGAGSRTGAPRQSLTYQVAPRKTWSVAIGLEWLLQPATVDEFLRDHWESQPLLVSRDEPDYFQALPGLDAVDELITATSSDPRRSSDDGRLIRSEANGELVERSFQKGPSGLTDVQDIYRAYHAGYTVIVNRLQRRSAAVGALCRALEVELHHSVGANLYLTPRDAQGFQPHVDTHDVFILQLHGVKEWHVADTVTDLPLAFGAQRETDWPSGYRTLTLRPGDVLYLPRGVPHEALTSASSSLHLTVGIHVFRWIDLVREAVGMLGEERLMLRQALPPGFLDLELDRQRLSEIAQQLAEDLADGDVAEGAKARLGSRLLGSAKVADPGRFRSIDGLERLSPDSVAVRAPGSLCRVRSANGEALIEFGSNFVAGPVLVEPALRFIAERERFTVDSLPGELAPQEKVELVSRLVSEGLLYLADNQGMEVAGDGY